MLLGDDCSVIESLNTSLHSELESILGLRIGILDTALVVSGIVSRKVMS